MFLSSSFVESTRYVSGGPQDEILPHGTMLELLRQGFSGAYDKVMYDRRGVTPQFAFKLWNPPLYGIQHTYMFWKGGLEFLCLLNGNLGFKTSARKIPIFWMVQL